MKICSLFILSIIPLATIAADTTIYETKDAQGVPSFSNQAPPADTASKAINIPDQPASQQLEGQEELKSSSEALADSPPVTIDDAANNTNQVLTNEDNEALIDDTEGLHEGTVYDAGGPYPYRYYHPQAEGRDEIANHSGVLNADGVGGRENQAIGEHTGGVGGFGGEAGAGARAAGGHGTR